MTDDAFQMTEKRAIKLRFLLLAICCISSVLCPHIALAVPLIRDAEIEHTLRQYLDPILRVDGLKPGAVIATKGAFLLKAELGKGEAEH